MAALLPGPPRVIHADGNSILLLDREPIRWDGQSERGLGWVDGGLWQPAKVGDWRDAALRGVTGLVLRGRRRYLHTAVSGLAPLFWLEDRGATYFASRIDPLVRSTDSRFSIDWDAWAAIIAMRYPLGERTPFAEIRRLPPFSTLRRRLRRSRVDQDRRPWAEIEPDLTIGEAASEMVEALRDALAPMPRGIVCPLSGGRDSRMLLMLLAADNRVARAVTVTDDDGGTHEADLAAPVAAACGVEHESIIPWLELYRRDWITRAERVEYQFVDHAWLVPLASRIDGLPTPVPDGFTIDVMSAPGNHFFNATTMNRDDGPAARRELFRLFRRYGHSERVLSQKFHRPLVARTSDQFDAAVKHLDGHPSQAILAHYATRSLRGVSTYVTGLLGRSAVTVAPGTSDAVVRAALRADAREKLGGGIYRECFLRLGSSPPLPTSGEVERKPRTLPRRWCSADALRMHRELLSEGPLAGHLAPPLRDWLDAPAGVEPSGDVRLGMESISLLHAWWQRYRNQLREADSTDLLG